MENRSVQFPNRYKMVPVPGTKDIFDFLPVPGNVYAEGTPFIKNTMLADDTAKRLGLPVTAVPNDAFQAQADFERNVGNQYVWEKRETYQVDVPVESSELTDITCSYSVSGDYPYTILAYMRADIKNGTVVLSDERRIRYDLAQQAYVTINGKPYRIESLTSTDQSDYTSYAYYKARAVSAGKADRKRTIAYPTNSDPAAYPPNVSDGFTYIPLGMLGNASGVEIVSRIGTGVLSAESPCEITFSRPPKLVVYLGRRDAQDQAYTRPPTAMYDRQLWQIMDIVPLEYAVGVGFCEDNYYQLMGKKSADGKTLIWYHGNVSNGLNSEGMEFFFMGIF